jgi:hypothetical protein
MQQKVLSIALEHLSRCTYAWKCNIDDGDLPMNRLSSPPRFDDYVCFLDLNSESSLSRTRPVVIGLSTLSGSVNADLTSSALVFEGS